MLLRFVSKSTVSHKFHSQGRSPVLRLLSTLERKAVDSKMQAVDYLDNSSIMRKRSGAEDVMVELSTKGSQNLVKKRKKQLSPEGELRLQLQMAAKAGDVSEALRVYENARKQQLSIPFDSYQVLLYLLCGGDDWLRLLPTFVEEMDEPDSDGDGEIEGKKEKAVKNISSSLTLKEREEKANEIFSLMLVDGGKSVPKEITYTTMARLAAAVGHPDEAFAYARELLKKNVVTRLRSFAPALIGYAEQGLVNEAFEVDEAIRGAGLELGEAELGRLMQVSAHGASWHMVSGVLHRLSSDFTVLRTSTMSRIRQYFASEAAIEALPFGSGAFTKWSWRDAEVDNETGECLAGGGFLKAIDLDQSEFAAFANGIATIAERHEKRPQDFQNFRKWLNDHGPFDIIIDGANIAFFGFRDPGGFSFKQIRTAVDVMTSRFPGKRVLVILHVSRTKGPKAEESRASEFLSELRREKMIYAAPPGSNDDWYWMYASVNAAEGGLLLSNDEMRDHIFQLLAPKYFQKWKQRHQYRYKIDETGKMDVFPPPPFTMCVQQLENGCWVFPYADGLDKVRWICAKPE